MHHPGIFKTETSDSDREGCSERKRGSLKGKLMGDYQQKKADLKQKRSIEMIAYRINVLYLTIIFMVFNSFRRINLANYHHGRVLGKGKIWELFFRRRTSTESDRRHLEILRTRPAGNKGDHK